MNSNYIETALRIYENGTKEWLQNGKFHRIDGPAIEYPDGTKYWVQNGQRHRTDGPAIEWSNNANWWYIEGVQYSEEEYNQLISK